MIAIGEVFSQVRASGTAMSQARQSSATWTGGPCSSSGQVRESDLPNQNIPHSRQWKKPALLSFFAQMIG